MSLAKSKCVKEIFKEYEKLSNSSGLMLNTDKTEILNFDRPNQFNIRLKYRHVSHTVTTTNKAKVNGIWLSKYVNTLEDNLNKIKDKVISQLQSWKSRGLSLLGRILVYKTFALSQVLFTAGCTKLTNEMKKELETNFYNFILKGDVQARSVSSRISKKD